MSWLCVFLFGRLLNEVNAVNRIFLKFAISLALVNQLGCAISQTRVELPGEEEMVREQLVVHSDFHIPERHRLIDELTLQRLKLAGMLDLPLSDEPIHIYLFNNEEEYFNYMSRQHPLFPNRRAFFVRSDDGLKVFAYWGNRVGEDLRHEVTHGYLHSVQPTIPLWLDEGIAEYFEVGRGKGGFNSPHVVHLAKLRERGHWQPNLATLEVKKSAKELTQTDYAEAWLWVHFLMTGDEASRALIADYLKQIRDNPDQPIESFLYKVRKSIPDYETQMLMHLEMMID